MAEVEDLHRPAGTEAEARKMLAKLHVPVCIGCGLRHEPGPCPHAGGGPVVDLPLEAAAILAGEDPIQPEIQWTKLKLLYGIDELRKYLEGQAEAMRAKGEDLLRQAATAKRKDEVGLKHEGDQWLKRAKEFAQHAAMLKSVGKIIVEKVA